MVFFNIIKLFLFIIIKDYSALPATSLKILARIYAFLALLCYDNP